MHLGLVVWFGLCFLGLIDLILGLCLFGLNFLLLVGLFSIYIGLEFLDFIYLSWASFLFVHGLISPLHWALLAKHKCTPRKEPNFIAEENAPGSYKSGAKPLAEAKEVTLIFSGFFFLFLSSYCVFLFFY